MLGIVLYSGISVVGLTAMEVVPKEMVSSAHGLACAIAQGKVIMTICSNNSLFLVCGGTSEERGQTSQQNTLYTN